MAQFQSGSPSPPEVLGPVFSSIFTTRVLQETRHFGKLCPGVTLLLPPGAFLHETTLPEALPDCTGFPLASSSPRCVAFAATQHFLGPCRSPAARATHLLPSWVGRPGQRPRALRFVACPAVILELATPKMPKEYLEAGIAGIFTF